MGDNEFLPFPKKTAANVDAEVFGDNDDEKKLTNPLIEGNPKNIFVQKIPQQTLGRYTKKLLL